MKKKFLYWMSLVGIFATSYLISAVIANLFTQDPMIVKWVGRITAVTLTAIANIDIQMDEEKSERERRYKTPLN